MQVEGANERVRNHGVTGIRRMNPVEGEDAPEKFRRKDLAVRFTVLLSMRTTKSPEAPARLPEPTAAGRKRLRQGVVLTAAH